VELQKANRLVEASSMFDIARKFNSENWVAYVNSEFNKNLRGNNLRPVELAPAIEAKVKQKYRRWEDRLFECGMFDEPRFCSEMGENFANMAQPLVRLAAHQFIRLKTIDPANIDAKIWLANLYLKWPFPDKTLEVTKEIEEQQSKYPLSLPYQIEVVRLKAWAYATMTNIDLAVKLLIDAQAKNPTVASLPETLSQIYIKTMPQSADPNSNLTNALNALEQLLRLEPNNDKALLNKGAINIQLKQYPEAITPLSKILQSNPKHLAARVNRALAYLNSKQWESARADYLVLLELLPKNEKFRIYYGLGESNYQLKENQKAREYFERYLNEIPKGPNNQPIDEESVAYQLVQNRLKELKANP
jgi:tetratricopeptide (TPR) repeat protein